MYLWKYWRESRITFVVGMALVGLLLWGVLKIPVDTLVQGRHGGGEHSDNLLYLFIVAPLTLPFAFLALKFGSFGVGRDLGEGSGSFLFSRPRSRAFFVWNDWAFGMTQLLLIVLATNAVLALAIHRLTPDSGPILLAGAPVSMTCIFLLHCAAGLLLTGLMFGLTYFSSVLTKSRGVLLAIGIVVVYLVGKSVVKYYWPSIVLPDLTLTEFSMSRWGPPGFASNLGLAIAARAAVALLFPVAAQMLLERRDVE